MRIPATEDEAERLYGVAAYSIEFVKKWVGYGVLVPNPWRLVEDLAPQQLELSFLASNLPMNLALALNDGIPEIEGLVLGAPKSVQLLAAVHSTIFRILTEAALKHGVRPDLPGEQIALGPEEMLMLRKRDRGALH